MERITSNSWVRYPMRYLKEGTYIITKYSKPVWTVKIEPYKAPEPVIEPVSAEKPFVKPFTGPVSKEYSTR